QYSLKVFTASDEISLGALVVADLALDSALPTTRMPSSTPPSSTDSQVTTTTTQPSNSTNEGSKDNNSLAIYVGLIGGLSGGLLGIVCILIAACAYCGWSARRKGFTELKATDAANYDGGASARSSVFLRMNPYHHTSAAAAADGGGGIDIEDVRSELTLLSLDPIAHLADGQHQGVRLEAMPGETLAPAPSMNGGESMIGTLPRTSSGASLAESTQCSTAVLRDRMDYVQVGALRMAARRALANLVHQSPASEVVARSSRSVNAGVVNDAPLGSASSSYSSRIGHGRQGREVIHLPIAPREGLYHEYPATQVRYNHNNPFDG
ncbi:hypothetical protein FOZ63_033128, partial [Perkinsus olseni]